MFTIGRSSSLRYRAVGRRGPVVVLLHGYAAPADDLLSFAEALVERCPVRAILPAGPVDYFGMVRAWWTIDSDYHHERMVADDHEALFDDRPPGLVLTRQRLLRLFLELRQEASGRPPILLGFSQGAMAAADLALRTGVPLGGLALLSGGAVAAADWPRLARHRAGLPCLVAHGSHDPVLPQRVGRQVASLMEDAGLRVARCWFRGGHEVRPTLDPLIEWFEALGPGFRSVSHPTVRDELRRRAQSFRSGSAAPFHFRQP